MMNHARFLEAQRDVYPRVVAELKAGRKQSHWIWFIFPQIAGLGSSSNSKRFALTSIEDAESYCNEPILFDRLLECSDLVLSHRARAISDIMGTPDDLKLRSSMTLFTLAKPDVVEFREVLDTFFEGSLDPLTLKLCTRDCEPLRYRS